MTVVLPELEGTVLVFLLVFARAGAMVMLLPAIGEVGVPVRVRLAFALAVSAALAPAVAGAYGALPQGVAALALAIAGEVTAGVLVGAVARLIMSALHVAGYLIATQTGLAFAQTVDPSQGTQGAIVSTFLTLAGVVVIFATGLHHLAIGAIRTSYLLIPPLGALPIADLAELALDIVAGAFALGLQLAAPFLIFGFVIYAALGVLSRLMPQLQVFFLAMPVNILAGFFLLMLLVGAVLTVFVEFFAREMGRFGF